MQEVSLKLKFYKKKKISSGSWGFIGSISCKFQGSFVEFCDILLTLLIFFDIFMK